MIGEEIKTLHERLLRFCRLKGITPQVSEKAVRCLIPGSFIWLTVYKKPKNRTINHKEFREFGIIEYSDRRIGSVRYIGGKAAQRLFDKLGERIYAIEHGEQPVKSDLQEEIIEIKED